MLDVKTLKAADIKGLSKSAMAELTAGMLARMTLMRTQLEARDEQAAAHIREIRFKDAKLESITFELARLKGMEVRRQDRTDECRAAADGRRDGSRGRGQPAGTTASPAGRV